MLKHAAIPLVPVLLLLFAFSALAADNAGLNIPPHVLEACDKEAPLSQTDIEKLVNAWTELSGTNSGNLVNEAVFEKHGLDGIRGPFVVMKVITAVAMLNLPEGFDIDMAKEVLMESGVPPALIATADDIALVRANSALLGSVPGLSVHRE